MALTLQARFPLGKVTVTELAASTLRDSGQRAEELLERHQAGDWGDVSDETRANNEEAVESGGRIESVYHTRNTEKVLVVTDPDRSMTEVLLPQEF